MDEQKQNLMTAMELAGTGWFKDDLARFVRSRPDITVLEIDNTCSIRTRDQL